MNYMDNSMIELSPRAVDIFFLKTGYLLVKDKREKYQYILSSSYYWCLSKYFLFIFIDNPPTIYR